MGRQQSLIKAKDGQSNILLFFAMKNEEWFSERDIYPICAVRVAKDIMLQGKKYKKGEVCLIVGGERHYQRHTEEEGLIGVPCVQDIVFIDNIGRDTLNEYFPTIEEDDFYAEIRKANEIL